MPRIAPSERIEQQLEQFLSQGLETEEHLVSQVIKMAAQLIVYQAVEQEVTDRGKWYAYLTNVLDPAVLPAECVVALYDQRWRIEDAFNVVKRLLGLAYFHTSSLTGLQIQLWATWLLYTLLVDLTDAVAEVLHRPFREVSLEMVFRGLYHFAQARHRGHANDPIEYFARKAHDLALIKHKRQKKRLSLIEQMELTIPSIA